MRTLNWVLSQLWNHRSNRGRQVATLANAVGWQVRKRLVSAPKSMKVFHGMRMLCYPDSRGAGVMIYSSGWPDFDDMYFVSRYLRPGDAVMDVGANMGIYTLLMAAAVGPTGRLLAFEPGEGAFEILTANVRLNQLSQVELRREGARF